MNSYKLAICQMKTSNNKTVNIQHAIEMIAEASKNGADVVALPEMFNCPYENRFFKEFAEEYPGETSKALSKIALDCGVYLIGGSIPEFEDGKIYNTSYVFDKSGILIGRHRKVHLFDIDVKNGVSFKESDTLSRGNDITVIDTEYGKIGVAICYDVRFPELSRLMALKGAEIVILPAAFNMTTGPAHWELSIRMRALDNQIFFAGVSPARDENASYISYANSMVSDPWGRIIGAAGKDENIIYVDIDRSLIGKIRQQLPLLNHRRTDLYKVGIL